MNILVLMRMMPDPAGELELSEDGAGLDREWLDFQLNDFDDHALEEAILLKEATGATVTALAVGEGASRVLQMAVARGADRALSLAVGEGQMITAPGIGRTIAATVIEHGIDLVMTGVQASEDLFGQVAPYIGGLLDWPHLSGTSRLAFEAGKVHVAQERGGGVVANYVVCLPAVLGVQTATKAPRYVSGSKLREAAKTPIAAVEAVSPSPLQGASAPTLSLPKREGRAEPLGNAAEPVAERLAAILFAKGFVTGHRL
jgi:electron transfer flavoprotein beta subunit